MEEMQKFMDQFKKLEKRVSDIDKVGVIELKKVYDELNSLDNSSKISVENFTKNSDNDLYEILNSLTVWKELKENIDKLKESVLDKFNSRKEILDTKFTEYRRLKNYRREIIKKIKEFTTEYDIHNALSGHINDSVTKEFVDSVIKGDERHILKAEETKKDYEKELYKLYNECRTLLDGGEIEKEKPLDLDEMLEELIRDKDEIVGEEKEEKSKKKVEEEPEEVEEEKKTRKPKKISVARNDEPEEVVGLEEIPVEEEDTEEEDIDFDNITPPVKTEEKKKEKKPKKTLEATEDEELPPRQELIDEDEKGEDEDLPFEIDESLDEEKEPVEAVVRKPKSKIWNNVGKVIRNAVIFLSLAGAAIHTGVIAGKNRQKVATPDKQDVVEETESEAEHRVVNKEKTGIKLDKTERVSETKVVSNTDKYLGQTFNNPTVMYQEEYVDTPVAQSMQASVEAPAQVTYEAQAPVEENFEIKLNPGETVYNTDTGVEVTYNGNATIKDDSGNTVSLPDRELEYNDNNQAIVTESDFVNNGPAMATDSIPTIGDGQRTGLEVSEEEAHARMTPEELDVANDQEEAWFQMLQENGLLNDNSGLSR